MLREATLTGDSERALSNYSEASRPIRAAYMQETTEQRSPSPAMKDLVAAAERAGVWAGEPLLHSDEDPAQVLAPETARRNALDEALTEIEAGNETPSSQWKVRFALMLGLERVLSEKPPHLASGTELRRHQVDALAGMLTELIAANQRQAEEPLNGSANGHVEPADLEEEDADFGVVDEEPLEEELSPAEDPGAIRRYRFRHPTASGKTIAAAGFVEAARTMGVLILTHRRLLVSQFNRELAAEGYGDRITPPIEQGSEQPGGSPVTINTYAWFARHAKDLSRTAY